MECTIFRVNGFARGISPGKSLIYLPIAFNISSLAQESSISVNLLLSNISKFNLSPNSLLSITTISALVISLSGLNVPSGYPFISFEMESIKVNFNVNVKPELLKLAEKSSLQIKVNLQSIDRIITNLLGNAIKFTPENGCISLQFDLSADMKYLIIQVSDSGIGISEKELPHIFDRLYRNFRAFNNKSKSNGLGLAIVQELVEYHDGEIWVESEINKGSDFLKVRIKYTVMKNYLMNYGELKV